MFDLLPTRLQQEIRQRLEQNQFTEAKWLYDQHLSSMPFAHQQAGAAQYSKESMGFLQAPAADKSFI